MIYHITDWDDAYANGAHIPQGLPRSGEWQNQVISMMALQPSASACRPIPTLSIRNSGKLK